MESIRELAARGMTQVALGVHTDNPNGAYALYSGLGYEVVSTWTTWRRPLAALGAAADELADPVP